MEKTLVDVRNRKIKHEVRFQKLYSVWHNMVDRCVREKHPQYHRYGGRGITVCEEWRGDYSAFHEWSINNGYKHEPMPSGRNKWSLEREDNSKGYSPDNCKWVTSKQQSRNTTHNRILNFNGEQHTLAGWAEITGLSWRRIQQRLMRGWTVERTLTEPVNKGCIPKKYRNTND